MIEGLWTVQFQGPMGAGGGVVVLKDGSVLGGDSGFTYVGKYRVEGEQLVCTVLVHNFNAAFPNAMGVRGDFTLELRTSVDPRSMRGTMSLVGQPGQLAVQLRRAV